MQFFKSKFKALRKKRGLTMKFVREQAKVTHTTLWDWENGSRVPPEKRIRTLAHILNIPVNEISDLQPEKPISSGNIAEVVDSWFVFADSDIKKKLDLKAEVLDKIEFLFNELAQASIITKTLMSTMDSIFYVKNPDLKYVTANDAFNKTLSLAQDFKVAGKTDEDFFPTREAKENATQDQEVIRTGKSLIKIEGFIPGTRKKHWGIVSKIPIFDTSGKIAGLVGTFVDITDRKKNEELRILLNTSLAIMTDGFSIVDIAQEKTIYLNKAIENIFGYPLEEFYLDFHFLMNTCIHPDDRKQEEEYLSKKKWPHLRRFRIIKPDGKIRWIEDTIYTGGQFGEKYVATICKDITEKILTEAHQERLKNYLNRAITLVWIGEFINNEFKFLYVNDATIEIFGVSKEKFLTNQKIWKSIVFPENKDLGTIYLTQDNEPREFELKIVREDGKTIWLHNKILKDQNLFLGTSKDITEIVKPIQ